jgi:hypothetical protein
VARNENKKDVVRKKDIDIDFNRDNILPKLNKKDLDLIGKKVNKDVIYKKSTIDRNELAHPELSRSEYNKAIKKSLYERKFILTPQKDRLNYHNFVVKLDNKHYSSVVLDTDDVKHFFEIVHVLKAKPKATKTMIRKQKREFKNK